MSTDTKIEIFEYANKLKHKIFYDIKIVDFLKRNNLTLERTFADEFSVWFKTGPSIAVKQYVYIIRVENSELFISLKIGEAY